MVAHKRVHRKCSGIKGSTIKVSKSFVCRGCTDQPASVDRTGVGTGDGARTSVGTGDGARTGVCTGDGARTGVGAGDGARTGVGTGDGASLELVDQLCYLRDMLSVDADAAVEARVCKGWNKFRQLAPLLTNKDVSSYEREIVQRLCAQLDVRRQ